MTITQNQIHETASHTTAIFALATTNAIGQGTKRFAALPAPTTEEEYNYITRGYQTQVSQGLDMKKGYHFANLFDTKISNYTFTAKALIRDVSNEIAGILIITHSQIWDKTYYMCIPHGNEQLANRYLSDLNNWDKQITTAYCQLVSLGFGNALASAYEAEKKINN
ncbi:hypothetical protein ACQ86N_03160 [Puia sp. P3]|uniref:hypothetical protein n=1 Tax=Puia sp. P3 TaxID=3423952 RepID=UPI003D6745F3